jgi:predicted TIM-barrel fold metal-dependent hydrolase
MLRDFAQNSLVKGVRLTFHRPIDRNWMVDGTNDWYWPLAEELGLPTMVHAPTRKAELGQIAARHPGLSIIIDHMGILAQCVGDAIDFWVQETADLHVHPNISVKVSYVPGHSTQPLPNLNIAGYVRGLADKMGAERCFWGTDLSRLVNHGLTYTLAIELEWIMGRGISERLNWRPPTPAMGHR